MKLLIIFFILCHCYKFTFSQFRLPIGIYGSAPQGMRKPIIDSNTVEHWSAIGSTTHKDIEISDNGKFFAYEIITRPLYSNTLVIKSTVGSFKREFANANPGHFTSDGSFYIFNVNDSLHILNLKGGKDFCKSSIASWKQPKNSNNSWIAYQENDNSTLVLLHLPTGNEQKFDSVINYGLDDSGQWLAFQSIDAARTLKVISLRGKRQFYYEDVTKYSFSTSGTRLLVQTELQEEKSSMVNLKWVELPTGRECNMYTGENSSVISTSIDRDSRHLVFLVQEARRRSVWYYFDGMQKAVKGIDSESSQLAAGFEISGVNGLSANHEYILLNLVKEQDKRSSIKNRATVDVWSYEDTILQCTQISNLLADPTYYLAIVDIESRRVMQISSPTERIKTISDNFAVVQRDVAGERFWRKDYERDSIWLISFKDGTKKYLNTRSKFIRISPREKYLLYFDDENSANYYSYNLATGATLNITANVPAYLADDDPYYEPRIAISNFRTGIGGWLEDDKAVLVYDNYDIWQVDLAAKIPPTNITNGYGNSNNTKLRLTRFNNKEILEPNATLLISGFNVRSKFNGFFRKTLGKSGNPELLNMGPYKVDQVEIGFLPTNAGHFNSYMWPVKAKDASVWIVKRESLREAPNYFLTHDFRSFEPLTDLNPHKQYKWMTNELVAFKQLDGKESTGILYKPEDFDPNKRYPVIFIIYEQFSHRLYHFPTPDYTESGFVNIPWFVSRGYLVFTPDIYFKEGVKSVSAYNCVVGAANHLSNLPFIDGGRMALSGHSKSGGFTNYVFTHTNKFAAVFEGAGVSDIISSALQLSNEPTSNTSRLIEESERGRGSIWESRDLWLAQASILNTDKTTSPLLIFHCKDDWAVPFAQGVEMFIALRRLNKRVWMLQYDGEGHNLSVNSNRKDLTIRLEQFFNHYLKGAPPPLWMTSGIPAHLKGFEYRYELNMNGNCGNSCDVCEKKAYPPN